MFSAGSLARLLFLSVMSGSVQADGRSKQKKKVKKKEKNGAGSDWLHMYVWQWLIPAEKRKIPAPINTLLYYCWNWILLTPGTSLSGTLKFNQMEILLDLQHFHPIEMSANTHHPACARNNFPIQSILQIMQHD